MLLNCFGNSVKERVMAIWSILQKKFRSLSRIIFACPGTEMTGRHEWKFWDEEKRKFLEYSGL